LETSRRTGERSTGEVRASQPVLSHFGHVRIRLAPVVLDGPRREHGALMRANDLTAQEQTNARAALRFLRVQSGTWESLGKVLRCTPPALRTIMNGNRPVSAA